MKDLEQLDHSIVEVKADLGSFGFFAHGSSRGLILGPLNAELRTGRDDHITLGIDSEGELVQVHRTIDGRKAWWETPESIHRWLSSLATTHTEQLAPRTLFEQNTYVISLGCLFIGYRLLESIFSFVGLFLRRVIFKGEVLRNGDQVVRVKFEIDERRVIWLRAVLEKIFVDISMFLRILPPNVLRRVPSSAAKIFLVNDFERLRDDTGILIGPSHVGLVSIDSRGRVKYLSLRALVMLIQTAEERLPIGKVSQMGQRSDNGQGFRIDIRVKNPSEPSRRLPPSTSESLHPANLSSCD